MPSFTKIFSFAALGLAAIAGVSASPASITPNTAARSLEVARSDCNCNPIGATITTLVGNVEAIVSPVITGTAATVNVEVVKGCIADIKAEVNVAVLGINAAADLEVNLNTVTGPVTVKALALLLCRLLALVGTLVKVVFGLLSTADCNILKPLLAELLILVCDLLRIVVGLVNGLLKELTICILAYVVNIGVVVNVTLCKLLGYVISILGCDLNALLGWCNYGLGVVASIVVYLGVSL
ncbi:hypothetical protein CYLTODRAFT_487889 [Cylindrobasidium torrendii FP15055 ss-10]|uniref:Hydrophobin n=1 Tax=Cylindrobasidium torrendii FP15055 ss-10 TaxID=1314674 RepID=A0A0D7BKF4_9AGAR|nr:hypothetical protein CYLTODRAFT_487889 [Cylindrobasidium torrendii FP15055 ss-10]